MDNFLNKLIVLLLVLIHFPFYGYCLFDYICKEKELYKPYLHIYKTRRGDRILDVGPGFHDLTDMSSVYVCINGVAYLYFSKSTELGEVYETPQLKMYAHSCEMYNVQPREGSASVMEVQLHLRAVLLLGDMNDYRRPSIQKFTAPYYFRRDVLNTKPSTDPDFISQPSLYFNASSLVVIGQTECTLLKGRGRNSLIKVRPHLFPDATSGKIEIGYLCKVGFQPLLEKASTPPGGDVKSEDERAPALALINDEEIRVEKCQSTSTFDINDSTQNFNMISQEIEEFKAEYVDKKDTHLEKYNKLVDSVLAPFNEEKTKLEAKKGEEKIKPKDVKKIEKQLKKLEDRIKVEEDKKEEFSKALTTLSEEITTLKNIQSEAKPDGAKGSAAKTDKEAVETAATEWEKIKEQKPPAKQSEIDAKEEEYEEAKKKAQNSARDFLWAMSDLELGLLKLKKAVDKVKKLSAYSPSTGKPDKPAKGKKGLNNFNPDGSTSVVITTPEEDCDKLPVLEEECQNGKPDKEKTCSIFKATLNISDPWERATEDIWKREILELIGEVFAESCDRIQNVKKFTELNNRIMGFYLTDEKIFNLKPNLTTDTCLNFKMVKNLKILGAAGVGSEANLNYKDENSFWNSIKLCLNDCKKSIRRMSFKEKGPGEYVYVKNAGTDREEELDILRHEEQADTEFAYNWPIDMNWKMFVAVLGMCMPAYEKKIPLITSRFFSLYTEYFLIPLRETWINPKDNIIFQFILGEFYNGHTEHWADLCMEASFIYSGQRDYRPPRSLLVNCASEHNYFVNGDFVKPI